MRTPFKSTLCAALLSGLGTAAHAQQMAASRFNEEFLGIGGNQPYADLSLFSFGNRVLAGKYVVDVSLNGRNVGQAEILFVTTEGKVDAVPCLKRGLLDDWGVNVAVFPALANAQQDACIDLAAVIPDATFTHDGGKQRLYVSIPQAALKRSARGAIGPEKWDKGITAGMLDYQLNFARYSGDTFRSNALAANTTAVPQGAFDSSSVFDKAAALQRNTLFAGLRGGFNHGDWRFRHFSTYNRGIDGKGDWQSVNTSAQRTLASVNGQLLVGDGNTPGNFFDSLPFRGAQMSSDDAMLPDSQQGYAPTIRGVAQTNARVTVRQNGYVVYSTFVAPGPFVIDDLYPSASSGDLEVVITEADGRQTKYIQAFSAVPTLLREGSWRYSATMGKYRSAGATPTFMQATLARGLGGEISLYGGFLAAHTYGSLLFGAGKNLRDLGAVSLDISTAHTTDRPSKRSPLEGERSYSGQSLRFLYAKSFLDSGTNFRVAGYRYSTSGYRTFQEAALMKDLSSGDAFASRRNEVRFELSQRIGDLGSVYASARQQSYWGTGAKDRLVQVGYSGTYKQFGYGVFYNHTTGLNRAPIRQIQFTLTVPLGASGASAQYATTRDSAGRVNQQASVYGSALDESRLTYNLTGGRANRGADGTANADSSASASASLLSQIGRFDIGHSRGSGYGQSTFGMAGGMLFHGGGLTLSQPLGETVVLVRAPDAQGVGFESQPGVATDAFGNAVIPNLTPYRLNRIAVRTADLGDTVEVKNAALDVVPTRGAVVTAKFETSVGYRLLMTLTDRKGGVLPLGSRIENEAGQEVGVVGPDGLAFVTGAGAAGRLIVRWGQEKGDQCVVIYKLPDEKNPPPIRELNGDCDTSAASSSKFVQLKESSK